MSLIKMHEYGRLHLGLGPQNGIPKTLGRSINVYQNFITRAVAGMFNSSVIIVIEGQKRYVNKKSFVKHLHSLGLDVSSPYKIKKILAGIKKEGYAPYINTRKSQLVISSSRFGETLHSYTRERLFKKLVSYLHEGNSVEAAKLIRKGAYCDKNFYVNGNETVIKYNERSMGNYYMNGPFAKCVFYSYTPLAAAVEKGKDELSKLIIKANGNKINSNDSRKTYKYKLTFQGYSQKRGYTKLKKTEDVIRKNNKITFKKV